MLKLFQAEIREIVINHLSPKTMRFREIRAERAGLTGIDNIWAGFWPIW
jgi:hypothetical protein